jgi:hypothetical protein
VHRIRSHLKLDSLGRKLRGGWNRNWDSEIKKSKINITSELEGLDLLNSNPCPLRSWIEEGP